MKLNCCIKTIRKSSNKFNNQLDYFFFIPLQARYTLTASIAPSLKAATIVFVAAVPIKKYIYFALSF